MGDGPELLNRRRSDRRLPMTPKVPVEHRTVTVKDVKLHYAIAGPGAPLVLLHGWPRRARAHDPRV
jgi:hypothetical protein